MPGTRPGRHWCHGQCRTLGAPQLRNDDQVRALAFYLNTYLPFHDISHFLSYMKKRPFKEETLQLGALPILFFFRIIFKES